MITIDAKESDVLIYVSGTKPIEGYYYKARVSCGSPAESALVAQNLNQSMRARLKEIREQAYAKGLADGRSKHKHLRVHSDGWA